MEQVYILRGSRDMSLEIGKSSEVVRFRIMIRKMIQHVILW